MDYFLTEDQLELRELTRKIALQKVKPVTAKHDQENSFPWDMVKVFREAGLFGVWGEEKYGGFGGGVMELVIVTEELSRVCGGIALSVAGTALGAFPLIIAGTEDQKSKWLPEIFEGEAMAAFGLTEPEAGSDAGGMRTTAKKSGNKYILNGTKHFITNGGVAKYYTVFALTDASKGPRGISCFLVEDGTPGFTYGKKEDKMGIRASATTELIFDECEIPEENLLGREGTGFITALKTLNLSRPGVASQALGIAQGALDLALDYSRERKQFGKPISDFQGIQFMLAQMATEIEAARALIYQTAKNIDSGAKNYSKESAMSKYYASEVAMRVTTNAVQIFGGFGYMKDYPIEKFMRDAKITQIYEGTSQIQLDEIARMLIKDAARKK